MNIKLAMLEKENPLALSVSNPMPMCLYSYRKMLSTMVC